MGFTFVMTLLLFNVMWWWNSDLDDKIKKLEKRIEELEE